MPTILSTERLLLREFTEDDAAEYHALNSIPEVIRYTGDPGTTSVEHARQSLRDRPIADYHKHGIGRLACIDKSSGWLIGFAGLKYLDELGEVDLGYRFVPDFWGRGLATEAAQAVLDHGFSVLQLERIIGLVEPENIRSVRVLEKLGMTFEATIEYRGEMAGRYATTPGSLSPRYPMNQAWAAEVVVSEELAVALIEEQFPALAPVRVDLLGAGWDNTAYRVNDTHVFRFPRRQMAVPFLEAETRLLPALAPRLPLPVPVPNFRSQPTERFSWPFSGYRLLPGRTACVADLDEDQRARAAVPLARFLSALHSVPTAEARRLGAGPDTLGRLDLGKRIPRAREDLERLAQQNPIPDPGALSLLLNSAPASYTPRADTLVHGDLYVRHLLVDEAKTLAGVIDWGDVHLGDPAEDLMIAHLFFPSAARAEFRAAYGPVEEVIWQVARLRALWHSLYVLNYADGIHDADLGREARLALRHVSEG